MNVVLNIPIERILSKGTAEEKAELIEKVKVLLQYVDSPKCLSELVEQFKDCEEILILILNNPHVSVRLYEELAKSKFEKVRRAIYLSETIPLNIKKQAFEHESVLNNYRIVIESSFCTEKMFLKMYEKFCACEIEKSVDGYSADEMNSLAWGLYNYKYVLQRHKKEIESVWSFKGKCFRSLKNELKYTK